jgi:hypothetical protein
MIPRLYINRFKCTGIPVLLFILPLFAAPLVLSCQNEGRWYPEADVTISSSVEYLDQVSGTKALQITLIIHNTSNASISSSAITVKVRTDKREYYQTAGSTTRIIPGGKIAVNTTVPYLATDENLADNDGVTLYSTYFD